MARPPSALRGHILDSALQLFATQGYKGASLHDIAQVAGCSKASLLYHFVSKEAILAELLTPRAKGWPRSTPGCPVWKARRRPRRPSPASSIWPCASGARSKCCSRTSPCWPATPRWAPCPPSWPA
ncbi:TetR/AcrR family transcriptional regulator [Nonomuraea recticatena]|uniref:TetR/AcrR family transcriptional regulator n=1 Tax=Nonomuraea recticatena TaxID=46178 RepID=UPI00361A4562